MRTNCRKHICTFDLHQQEDPKSCSIASLATVYANIHFWKIPVDQFHLLERLLRAIFYLSSLLSIYERALLHSGKKANIVNGDSEQGQRPHVSRFRAALLTSLYKNSGGRIIVLYPFVKFWRRRSLRSSGPGMPLCDILYQ